MGGIGFVYDKRKWMHLRTNKNNDDDDKDNNANNKTK